MRIRRALILAACLQFLPTVGGTAEVLALPPSDLIVTVYRAPFRTEGSFDLNELNGFALITETRTVRLPAGESRLRFEGVADGIEPASAIEKNRDARLLSPSALVAATVGKSVQLLRTNRKTGETSRLTGTLLSDDEGVVLQTESGIEALRCSGLPETFSFQPAEDLSAQPTLSVRVRTPTAVTQQVTLSYLARGFDWAADYTASLSADGKTLDLGAWVTLANGNGVSFPAAHAQVVAGAVNREDGEVAPIYPGEQILAQCWPRGSTSDSPAILQIARAVPFGFDGSEESDAVTTRSMRQMLVAAPAALQEIVATGMKKVQQEQLGDLKLYRVPDRTSVASRQSKQVRLLDRGAVPVTTVYRADLEEQESGEDEPALIPVHRLLRTKNTLANHLGLPLPSGSVAVFGVRGGARVLEHESALRDLAVNEEVEIDMGESPDVEIKAAVRNDVERVEITNAGDHELALELRPSLPAGGRVIRADHPVSIKDGRPIFRLEVPANGAIMVRFQTEHIG
jgi:hypothetical protein